ncbi:MAG: hypothetical protein WKF31_08515 [Thermoleophilaceae bacterium]
MTGPLSAGGRRRPPRRGPARAAALLLGIAGLLAGAFVALYPSVPLAVFAGTQPDSGYSSSKDAHERTAAEQGSPYTTSAAVALERPDALRLHFRQAPALGSCSTSTPVACSGAIARRHASRSPRSRRS